MRKVISFFTQKFNDIHRSPIRAPRPISPFRQSPFSRQQVLSPIRRRPYDSNKPVLTPTSRKLRTLENEYYGLSSDAHQM